MLELWRREERRRIVVAAVSAAFRAGDGRFAVRRIAVHAVAWRALQDAGVHLHHNVVARLANEAAKRIGGRMIRPLNRALWVGLRRAGVSERAALEEAKACRSPKRPPPAGRELSAEWERRLAAEGLGAEPTELPKWTRTVGSTVERERAALTADVSRAFFAVAERFRDAHDWRGDAEGRAVWVLLCEGLSERDIVARTGVYLERVHAHVTRLRALADPHRLFSKEAGGSAAWEARMARKRGRGAAGAGG